LCVWQTRHPSQLGHKQMPTQLYSCFTLFALGLPCCFKDRLLRCPRPRPLEFQRKQLQVFWRVFWSFLTCFGQFGLCNRVDGAQNSFADFWHYLPALFGHFKYMSYINYTK
jgi:hypothetical protein